MKKTLTRQFHKTLPGFSTGEVILSMFVLSVGLVTIMALISSSLKYSLASRDMIIAAELAQEGVELVRNVRDNDFADGGTGFGFFPDGSNYHCRIDYNDNTETDLDCTSTNPATNLNRYYLQYQGGLYGHFNSSQEKFSRYLYVNLNYDGSPGNNDRALVRSFVYWQDEEEGYIPAAGDTEDCTLEKSCVFTELYLTSWK